MDRAFRYINLETVYGECYTCGHPEFWRKCVERYGGQSTVLPKRKYYQGVYHSSLYFTFDRSGLMAGELVREEANEGRV